MSITNSKKKNSKQYFTLDVDEAIIKFNSSNNPYEKEKIYRKVIYPAFDKLSENLINVNKCPYIDSEFNDLKHDLVSFLTEKLGNFSQDAGKAYSYYTVAGRNYLIALNNKNYSKRKKRVELDTVDDERDVVLEATYSDYKESLDCFISEWIDSIDNSLYDIFITEEELSIADSILEVFRIRKSIDTFNKKALYVLIRERTGLKTPKITKVINMLKEDFLYSFDEYLKR